MEINKGKRDILIFPKFNNIELIQEVRNKYDSLANILPPHITLAFPFSDKISDEELIRKLTFLLTDFEPFTAKFNGISLSNDKYIFLNCIQGTEEIINLHHEIYKQILPNHINKSIEYIPHITLGQVNNINDLYYFTHEFKAQIDEIALELIGEHEESIIIKKIKIGGV